MENNFQYISAAVSDKGLSEKRPQNEDSYLELNKSGLFAVADGVGGAQAGEVASSMAMEILAEAFVNMQNNGDAEEVMKAGIEKANAAIFQMSQDLASLSSMATTIVAVHLAGNIATIGHVGDSRLYRLDPNGHLYRETQDHSIVEEEVRAGRMTAAQAANHPSRNVISRALGAEAGVEIDLKTIMFEPNTTFLLCSDGITRHIEDFEIRELLSSQFHPEELCQKMKNICYSRGAEDNLTAVVVRVSSEIAGTSMYNGDNQGTATDFEEATIATARPASASADAFTPTVEDYDGAPTQDLKMPAAAQQESAPAVKFIEPEAVADPAPATPVQEEVAAPAENYVETSQPTAAVQTAASVQPAAPTRYDNEPQIFESQTESSSGFFGKLASALIFLLLGAAIGAGGYYFYQLNQPQPAAAPPPPISEMKTPNIALTGFEENRRNVDRNPQAFIDTLKTEPKDAEDFYLRGRAFLLIGKYPEARQAFTEARNRLGQTTEVNSKTLATEIAMAMAIIDTPFAQKAFEKDMQAANPANTANTNANVSR